jgi:hypothetical protein
VLIRSRSSSNNAISSWARRAAQRARTDGAKTKDLSLRNSERFLHHQQLPTGNRRADGQIDPDVRHGDRRVHPQRANADPHGGWVWADSAPGAGCSVHIALPAPLELEELVEVELALELEVVAEELVAELGAAFLAAEFSFDGDVRHAGYIAN